MNPEKGQQVFGDEAEFILAEQIVKRTKKNTRPASVRPDFQKRYAQSNAQRRRYYLIAAGAIAIIAIIACAVIFRKELFQPGKKKHGRR